MNQITTRSLRAFEGVTLYADSFPGHDAGNDFAAAVEKMTALPEDSAARERLHIFAQNEIASLYGSPHMQEKPYAQIGATAFIPVSGILVNRFNGSYGWVTGYNAIRSQINAALADTSISNIVLDINSPGGHAAGCFELCEDIREAREQKPILAVVDGVAASGAYAIASAATRIVAAPSSKLGSIGVYVMHVSIAKALETEGVKITFIKAGDHKVDGNPYEDLSDEARASIQAGVDATYAQFLSTVEAGRGKRFTAKQAKETEARVYDASAALALGMVDAVSTPKAALKAFVSGNTSDHQQQRTEHMTEKTPEQIAAEARNAERTRIAGITGHAEAKGRESLAAHLAHNTDMTVEAAVAALAASPKASAEKATEKPQERDRLSEAMDRTEQPNVGADGGKKAGGADGDDTPEARAARMLAAWSGATGIALEGNGKAN